MQAGRLDQRITLQAKSTTRGAIGDEVVSWVDEATVWAEVVPLRGRAWLAANQMQQAVDLQVRIRTRAGVDPTKRLKWKEEPYDIVTVIPGTGPYLGALEIMAVRGVRDGR